MPQIAKQAQLERAAHAKGFIAALDQSGGSTPRALLNYGITADEYHTDAEMFELVHQMRSRIITSPAFKSDKIFGAILFERTMESKIGDKYTAEYLWENKRIVPFLKIDDGLMGRADGVQLMKSIPELEQRLKKANQHEIFGTKERSVIYTYSEAGIRTLVQQQFSLARIVCAANLVPIIEPEVNIRSVDKARCEDFLHHCIKDQLATWPATSRIMFKFSIPDLPDLYHDLYDHPAVVRVVALSGGYTTDEACSRLAQNHDMPASFSRALLQNLHASQTDAEFDAALSRAINQIYQASIS